VDIKVVIEELDTEEMKGVPEISMQLHEALVHKNMPSHNSKFAITKPKLRSMKEVRGPFVLKREMFVMFCPIYS